MKQTPSTDTQSRRQFTIALMLVALSFVLWRTKPPEQPVTDATVTSTAAGEAPAPTPLGEAQVEALLADGQPPFVRDLQLDDPAWASLQPDEQIAAIRKRIGNLPKDDPRLPTYQLTIAWLYDQAIADQKLEAANEYSALSRYLTPDKQKDPKRAAYRFAGQAKLRASEIYLERSTSPGQEKLRGKARKELDAISSNLQRFGNDLLTLWRRDGKRWVEVDDAYGFVLEKIDRLTRDSVMYKAIDTLVRMTGGRHGWNVVIALIILAVGLKGAMFPLSRKSYRSMAEMQKLQPVIKELQKKHKDNPQKLNQEMMQIYGEHGVNPLGGCLPMIVQIPVFIFVYQGIRAYTYHFHNVDFLWIKSLAQPDMILLVIYAGSMFVTQFLTMKRQPPPQDPAQAQTQKMMLWVMPLMFTYMMYLWKLPSAFYLYWLTFNIISTIEQTLTHRDSQRAAITPAPVSETLTGLRESSGGKRTKERAGRASRTKKKRSR